MITRLGTTNAGVGDLTVPVAERLTLLTGEDATGKTFVLDCLWRAVSGEWPVETNAAVGRGYPPTVRDATGGQRLVAETARRGAGDCFVHVRAAGERAWRRTGGRHAGLAFYAMAGGEIAFWRGGDDPRARPTVLAAGQTRNGNGAGWPGTERLLAAWRRHGSSLAATSDRAAANLVPARCRREETTAGAAGNAAGSGSGAERFATLAIVAAWAWETSPAEAREDGVVVLSDDIETHLHPSWQREAIDRVTTLRRHVFGGQRLQLVVATKAPLVAASAEPWFDPRRDVLVKLAMDREGGRATAQATEFTVRGTADNWLTSNVFGLRTSRGSVDAESAVLDAEALLLDRETDPEKLRRAHARVRAVLGDADPFWVRWIAHLDDVGIET